MSFITDIFGGDNEYEPEGYKVDEGAYQYGGAEGGADEAASRYRAMAENAQNRQGVQVDYGEVNRYQDMGLQARAGQERLANQMEARAMGQVPSIAQMQADRQMGQATAEQASQMASARGPAALAMASQNAAGNIANVQSNISGQAQINAAQERERAEQAAMGARSQMRGQDQGATDASAQRTQFQAGMEDSQRGRNDAMTMGMTGYETGVRKDQLNAGMNREAQKSGNELSKQQMQAQIAEANAQRRSSNALGVTSAVAGAAASSSDARAKVPLSTWGSGKGLDEEGVGEFLGKMQADAERAELRNEERDARLANTGGMQAVDFDAVSRLQKDDAAKTRAYEARGLNVSERDKQNAAMVEQKGGAKKDEPGGLAKAMGAFGQGLAKASGGKAATISSGYVPPQLIPISGSSTMSDMTAKNVNIGALSGINDLPAGAMQMPKSSGIKTPSSTSDERAKEFLPLSPDAGGRELQVNDKGRGFFAEPEKKSGIPEASLSGPSSVGKARDGDGGGLSRVMKANPYASGGGDKRRMSDEEAARLSREADKMMSTLKAQKELADDAGPAVRRAASGTPESDYNTELTMAAEPAYKRWLARNAPPGDTGEDYDYRGAFAEGLDRSGRAGAHFPDTYKKPNHETFSDESQYAEYEPEKAGSWRGETYVPPGGLRRAIRSGMETKQPLMMSDDEAKIRAAKAEAWDEGAQAGARYGRFREGNEGARRERKLAERAGESMRARHEGGENARTKIASGLSKALIRRDTSPMADANRAQVASPYAYKPEFTPPEQEPGEPNVGPMAQNLAKDPVARTAVKKDPNGMLMLDTNKLLKLHSGGIAHLQNENDELKQIVASLASRMRRPR